MSQSWKNLELTARAICCVRGGSVVFRGLDFRVASGGALVLRGANGCGKTSLLRQIAGLLPLADGSLNWQLKDGHEPLADCVQYVGHLNAVKPYLSVRENLKFWAQLLGGHVAIDQAADFWGLSGLLDTPASILSQGQRQRVALALLLLNPRPLWLLDEPQAGLDRQNLDRLYSALINHLDAGGMTIIASHAALNVAGARDLDMTALARPERGEAA